MRQFDVEFFGGAIVGLAIGLIAGVFICTKAHAKDNGQYSQVNPDIKNWIENLKDKDGIGCCNTADGYDVQWDTLDGQYRVFIENEWIVVPPKAVLEIPNKIGVARVWWFPTYDLNHKMRPQVRCFLPGAGI